MEDLPPNVILSKWLPQNDVLGNDNLKVFITHGGQSSFQESLCYQKPVVRKGSITNTKDSSNFLKQNLLLNK